MNRLRIRLAAIAFGAFSALATFVPVLADEEGHTSGSPGIDVVPMATWMIVGTLVAGLSLSILYLFKRRIGAFPKNPTWVAPITVMRSQDLPEDFGDAPAEAHH
jgi:hypothetical protein